MNPTSQDKILKDLEEWERITAKVYADPKLKALKDKWMKEFQEKSRR